MDTRMRWRLIFRNFLRAMGRSGITLCLVIVSAVLLEGCGPQESEEAAASLLAVAEQGDAAAQHNLGVAYHQGQGVAQNYEEAVRWYRMAAEQGFVLAQHNLGVMYAEGLGIAEDYAEAYAWIRTAVTQGFPNPEINPGPLLDEMTATQAVRAERLAREYQEKYVRR